MTVEIKVTNTGDKKIKKELYKQNNIAFLG